MIIELTKSHGGQHNPIWINTIYIRYMEKMYKTDETVTVIWFMHSHKLSVMETPEEIIELIKQAK